MTKPHVVGVVGNDIVSDSRVKKTAAAMSAAGYRSTILCYTVGSERVSEMGDVEVRRVPVPWRAKGRYGRVPNPTREFGALELADRHLGPRTARLGKKRRLEAQAAAGHDVRAQLFVAKLDLWLRRQVFRLRRRGNVTRMRVIRRFHLTRVRSTSKALARFRDPVGQALDYEVVFGPILEELEPDIIHAHDVHMIGLAVNAARFLRARGIDTKVIYDAHELVEGISYPQIVVDAWLELEGAHIHDVDAVIGVSAEQVARIKERYDLPVLPDVVHNAPTSGPVDPTDRTLRDEISDGRILVYHGNVGRSRGVFTLVEALQYLPDDVHAAIVAPPDSPMVEEIEERALELGVHERVHLSEFVPAEKLQRYLESADLAVIPLHLTGNTDISLPNKLFEAIQADLPVLSSNMTSLSRFHRDHKIGLLCEEQNPRDLADKALEMLADLDSYRATLTPELKRMSSWDAQAEVLIGVCNRLLGRAPSGTVHVAQASIVEQDPYELWGDYRRKRLAIGPRNMAGQAFRVARAVEQHLGIDAVSFALDNGRFAFPCDHLITKDAWKDPAWQMHQLRLLSSTCTHAITESGTGLYGALNGGFIDEQIVQMRKDRLEVAVLLHGSEIRDPHRHRSLPFSPYASDDPLIGDLEQAVARLRRHLDGLDVPFFVTTPDLRADIDAEWLPVVIDPAPWAALDPAFERDTPVVLHMPTNGLLKGSDHVDEVLFALEREGLIDYLRPTESMQPADVAATIEKADIVIDGIVLGAYGVMSCQTMAAGRIAVANIRDLGGIKGSCPILDADPSTLGAVLRDLLSDRDSWGEIADAGRAFVDEYHDGAFTAQQLTGFLGA